MTETWVVNASPVIALDSIGRLDLLGHLGHDVAVPPAVLREVSYGGRTVLPPALAILDTVEPVPTVVMWGLGAGNQQGMLLRLELGIRPAELSEQEGLPHARAISISARDRYSDNPDKQSYSRSYSMRRSSVRQRAATGLRPCTLSQNLRLIGVNGVFPERPESVS